MKPPARRLRRRAVSPICTLGPANTMSANTLPRLRDDAIVRPFDDRGPHRRYVVALDGHHFVVTPVVAVVLDESRRLQVGECDLAALSARVAARLGRKIPCDRIEALLLHHAPRRFFAAADARPHDESPVKLRRLLIRGERLNPLLQLLGRLFDARAAIVACTLIALIGACLALQLWQHGAVPASTSDHLIGFALTLIGIFIHELGHLAACHRFGGHHGGIGIGAYWFLPAFYAEVHGAWLLPRLQRAAVDVGGIYLQACFIALLALLYLAQPMPALLVAIVWSQFLMLHTLNPVLKFDGYWLLCDLAGVHNLHRTLGQLAQRVLAGNLPDSAELRLLSVFTLLACAYFTYVFAMLGNGVGSTIAALQAAWLAADGSLSSLARLAGHATLLVFMTVAAAGLAVLVARAARDITRSTAPLSASTERKST